MPNEGSTNDILGNIFPTGSIQTIAIGLFDKNKESRARQEELLTNMTADVATSFANGMITTPLKAVTGSYAVKNVKDFIQASTPLIATIGDYFGNDYKDTQQIQELLADLATNTVTSFTGYLMTEVKNSAKRILTLPSISYINSEALNRFKKEIISKLPELLKSTESELFNNKSKIDPEEAESEYKEKAAKKLKELDKKSKNILTKANEKIGLWASVGTEWANNISYYITMGPDMLDTIIRRQYEPAFNSIHTWCNDTCNQFDEFKANATNTLIDLVYKGLMGTFTWLMKSIFIRNRQKVDKLVNKNRSTANAAVNDALSKVANATGKPVKQIDIFEVERYYNYSQKFVNITKTIITMTGS